MTDGRRKVVLLTGGTGLLGQGVSATVPAGWSIVSTHLRPYRSKVAHVDERTIDVRDRAGLERLFAERAFDAVVHAAGIASVDYSEHHPEESLASNVGGTRHIVELCAESRTRLIYISTNAVFDGRRAPYGESDPVNPINAYGRIKVACERLVAATIDRYVIARPILMYGWPHPMGRPNPVTWVIDALRRGETIHVVDDVYENPLHNMCAAAAIWAILERDVGGIVHLAGTDVMSRYDLARAVARTFALDGTLIRRVSSSHFPDIAPRPSNTSLTTTRMEGELGVAPWTVAEGLRSMATSAGAAG